METLKLYLVKCELTYLRALLNRANGVINDAVRVSGLHRKTLFLKMRKYNLKKEDFK